MDNLENVEDLTLLWNFDESMDDLKMQLYRVMNEVAEARKEGFEQAKINKENVKKLIHLLEIAYKERDEAKDQLRRLLMVKAHTLPSCPLPTFTTLPTKQEQPNVSTDSNTCSLTSNPSITLPTKQQQSVINDSWNLSPKVTTILPTMMTNHSNTTTPSSMDSYFTVGSSPELYYSDNPNCANSSHDPSSRMLDNLANGRPRPEKGKLLQSVMDAGPLLDSLLVAGSLPKWSNPPQVAHAPQIPTVPISMSKRPRFNEIQKIRSNNI